MGPLKAGTGCSPHWAARGGSTGLPLGPRPMSHGTIPQAAASSASKTMPNGMSCTQSHVIANSGSQWISRNRGASSSHVRHWASHSSSTEMSTSINSLAGQMLVPAVCRASGRESGILVSTPQGKAINNMGSVASMTTRDKSCAGATTTRTRGGTVVIVATTSPQSEVVAIPQQRMIRSIAPCSSQQLLRLHKSSQREAASCMDPSLSCNPRSCCNLTQSACNEAASLRLCKFSETSSSQAQTHICNS